MSSSAILDWRERGRGRTKIYGLKNFMDPGCPMDFYGAFRDNIREFLQWCTDVERRPTNGMPTWCTLLVDESSGVLIPLYTIEECVNHSRRPFCDYCRSTGWSHHLVSRLRYHIIIPADDYWEMPLQDDACLVHNHLLYGLLHCNGFGHLLCVNGREGGSKFVSGQLFMDVWDRLCTSLHVREVTVTDTSRKKSVDFRLLHSVAHGGPWFARWGYVFRLGSFGVTKEVYARAVNELASLPLDTLVQETNKTAGSGNCDLGRIIAGYRRLRWSDPCESFTRLANVRDLLGYLLCLKNRPNTLQSTTPASRSRQQKKRVSSFVEKRKRCRDFDIVAEELGSRWPARRLRTAAQVIVDALLEKGGMTRQEVRDVARLTIGDTGLLDFVLKWLGNCVVGRHVVRRTSNPITRVLEFSLEEVGAGEAGTTEALVRVELESTQTERDVRMICDAIVAARPDAVRAVLDCKHWVKKFGLVDDRDDRLRFFCVWAPSEEEMKELTRPMGPPEVLVVEALASVGDLRREAERAMRETYCMMEGFKVKRMEGVEGEEWDPVMLGGAESGSVVVVSGEGADLDSDLRYEGGMDTWAVGCACGAQDDDGERMVECDGCEVWHHTRCIGISDGLPVPPLFLCSRCSSSILGAAASVDTEMDLAW